MGVAFYPVFENAGDGWPDDMNGKWLASAANMLDKIAQKAKVQTLHDFYSMTREEMICELLDGDPDDPSTYDESNLLEEKWFDPKDGLQTIGVLIDQLPAVGTKIDKPDEVLEDLIAFKRHLERAKQKGLRWHLAMDI